MKDERMYASQFYIKPRRLQIFRVERHGTATILWTSRTALLRYLQDLEAAFVPVGSPRTGLTSE